MKGLLILAGLVVVGASAGFRTPGNQIPLYKQPDVPVEQRVKDLLSRMTVEEKARQLDMYHGIEFVDKKLDDTHATPDAVIVPGKLQSQLGVLGAGSIHDLYPSAEQSNAIQKWVIEHERLGIPALFLEEGLHGYIAFGQTVYPSSINLASTWDPDMATKTAAGIGSEARSNGVDMLLGPVLDVAREPRWGRIEEDFGEDPFLTGRMGAAYVRGMQGTSLNTDHTVISEPKHFAGHGSPESGLNTDPVHAGEREVRSIMLRSFEPAIREAGAWGVMAAYHEIDGVPCAGNSWLMTDVLRGEWGFRGFVLSDLGAIGELYHRHHVAATPGDAVRLALRSGVDMQFYDFSHEVFQGAIVSGIKSGSLTQAVLDQAVGRVLRVKFELGLFDHPYIDTSVAGRTIRNREHLETSLQSARESMCLLKNDKDLLPLSKSTKRIAVVGPNTADARMGDYTAVQGVHGVSMLDGVKKLATGEIVFDDGSNIESAVAKVRGCDVAILDLGEREGLSGEGSDRSSLDLPDNQEALLEAISATGVPVVLVLQNGRPLSIPWAADHIPAIVEAWYPGEFGGTAIAETLFGDNNPAGRLPISFPRSVGTIPDFYNYDMSKMGKYVDGPGGSVFTFGQGMSYTQFKYSNLKVSTSGTLQDPHVSVTFDVTNTGRRAGDEVAQLYLHQNTASVETPERALKAFKRLHLESGKSETVALNLGRYELEVWGSAKRWGVEAGSFVAYVGGSSKANQSVRFSLN